MRDTVGQRSHAASGLPREARHVIPRDLHRCIPRVLLSIALVWATVTSCDGGTDPDRFSIEFAGRVERSATAQLRLSFDGVPFDPSQVTWSVSPEGAVEFTAPDSVTFLDAGNLTFTAVTVEERLDFLVPVPPPPTIVFDLLRNGNRDIYRAALDGGDTLRLTTSPADDSDPSAVGNTIIFVSYRDGNGELYATTLDGAPAERLTFTDVSEAAPDLSPDGAHVAYTRSEAGVPKLWLSASDGSAAQRLTGSFGFAGSIEASPSWAPDGNRIAFVSTHPGSADLFVHTMSPADFSVLVPDSAGRAEVEPAWSPDGAWVAFATDRPGDTEIYLLAIGTGALTRVTERVGADGQPTWTGDDRLVFVSWENQTPRLRWLDLSAPDLVHEIPVGDGEPRHPAGVRGEGNP
jgi:TolB protein